MKKNYSLTHRRYLRKLRLSTFSVHFIRILLLALIILVWELGAKYNLIDPFITSSPSRIIKQLSTMIKDKTLFTHTWITLYETLLAFAISTVVGTIVAIILYSIPYVRKVLDPYLIVLNSLPKIALGPLIIVWVGTGTKAIVLMGILICIVITTMTMLNGYLNVPKEKVLLLKTMGANKVQILFKLILPATFSDFISVMKINIGMSLVGVIMGEYLTSKAGLGYLIVYGGLFFKLDLVMSSIVVLCILATIMYFCISLIDRCFNKKHN